MSSDDEILEKMIKERRAKQEEFIKRERALVKAISSIDDKHWRLFLGFMYDIRCTLREMKDQLSEMYEKLDTLSYNGDVDD